MAIDAATAEGDSVPAAYQKDSLLSPSMAASLGSRDWLTIAKNPEMSIADVDRSGSRTILHEMMEKKGSILPPTHEFTQTVRRISERLGVPEDTEILVVDS